MGLVKSCHESLGHEDDGIESRIRELPCVMDTPRTLVLRNCLVFDEGGTDAVCIRQDILVGW